jgi:hypothetical protein
MPLIRRRGRPSVGAKYQLVFAGSADTKYPFPKYYKLHQDMGSARLAAAKVWEQLTNRGLPTACHTPIVYGPGCGQDGTPVNPW